MEIGAFDSAKIKKTIIHAGTEYKKLLPGTRVYFHFVTRKCSDQSVIDDSRKIGKPMELVIGKKFKFEVWETVVQAMAVNEVASFQVDKSLTYMYPIVSKTLRDGQNPDKARRKHCCGHAVQSYGLGYEDLDSLLKSPCDLEFNIELIRVESEGEYEKESWQLNEEDRLKEIPKLKEEGNYLFSSKKYTEAAEKYGKAIGYLDQMMLCEKPGDEEWKNLNDLKLPILLNFAQCKLSTMDYYEVIEHCTTVLQYQPDNPKALYRRAKAHAAIWNTEEAKEDLDKLVQVDPSLKSTATSMLKEMNEKLKSNETIFKSQLQGKLF